MITIQKAVKHKAKLRLALSGPSGSGKSFTALELAMGLANGGKVGAVDSECGSLSLYADKFDFDVYEMKGSYSPENYTAAIKEFERLGYAVLIIDSLSHAWCGVDGALDQVDKAVMKSQSKNSYFAWRNVTPLHNELVDTILQSNMHIIVTMRVKTDYVIEKNGHGKDVPKKIGLAPIMRDGIEYEFTVTGDLDMEHNLMIGKTRIDILDGKVYHKATREVSATMLKWLNEGEDKPVEPTVQEISDARWSIHKMLIALCENDGNVLEKAADGKLTVNGKSTLRKYASDVWEVDMVKLWGKASTGNYTYQQLEEFRSKLHVAFDALKEQVA
jgi:RecA/RadA recombinase